MIFVWEAWNTDKQEKKKKRKSNTEFLEHQTITQKQ